MNIYSANEKERGPSQPERLKCMAAGQVIYLHSLTLTTYLCQQIDHLKKLSQKGFNHIYSAPQLDFKQQHAKIF